MGCDIHIVLERRDTDHDRWVGVLQLGYLPERALYLSWYGENAPNPSPPAPSYATFFIKLRDYDFFNALCGVRGAGSEFGYTPKGLPEDASDLTLMDLGEEDQDLHSHSWLDMIELQPVLAAHKAKESDRATLVMQRMGDPRTGNLDLLHEFIHDRIDAENIDEWRLVFAFDN